MAFDNSVMVTLRERPVPPRHHRDSTPQPSDCEATMEPRRHRDALFEDNILFIYLYWLGWRLYWM